LLGIFLFLPPGLFPLPPPEIPFLPLYKKNAFSKVFLGQIRQNFGKHFSKFVFKVKILQKRIPKFLFKDKKEFSRVEVGGGRRTFACLCIIWARYFLSKSN
jgi:hypothetical protein